MDDDPSSIYEILRLTSMKSSPTCATVVNDTFRSYNYKQAVKSGISRIIWQASGRWRSCDSCSSSCTTRDGCGARQGLRWPLSVLTNWKHNSGPGFVGVTPNWSQLRQRRSNGLHTMGGGCESRGAVLVTLWQTLVYGKPDVIVATLLFK